MDRLSSPPLVFHGGSCLLAGDNNLPYFVGGSNSLTRAYCQNPAFSLSSLGSVLPRLGSMGIFRALCLWFMYAAMLAGDFNSIVDYWCIWATECSGYSLKAMFFGRIVAEGTGSTAGRSVHFDQCLIVFSPYR